MRIMIMLILIWGAHSEDAAKTDDAKLNSIEAIRLNPNSEGAYSNLSNIQRKLNKIDYEKKC